MKTMHIIQGYLELGALQQGLDLVDKSFENFERTGDQFCLPEIYRLKGELLFAKDKEAYLTEIQSCYQTSWALAKEQGSKSLELRAAISLAKLHQYQDDPKNAQKILSETYEWFTEGFDTADLKEAKTLLESFNQF
jgi:predicted ATPase